MANQRVLDDNENDKSTKDGASDQGSHHDDMLGHILEDISLDEWEVDPDPQQSVAAPDIMAREIPVPDAPDLNAPSLDAPVPSVSDIQDIQLPDDDWAPSAIVPMPETVPMPEIESALDAVPLATTSATTPSVASTPQDASLFAFSMMQRFGSLDASTSPDASRPGPCPRRASPDASRPAARTGSADSDWSQSICD
ncbi:MAG: hypothetical protein HYX67_00340 [Candidatus Melainabacteria bacterium]|nr:hypothetical protein [Candidatus Melainabacteria bacterium]